MKKSIVYLIHISFWLSYFLLLFVIIGAATQGFSLGPNFFYILKLVIPVAILPAFSAFYLFYFYLFPKYITQRKIGLSFVYGILFSMGSAFIGGVFFTLILGKNAILAKSLPDLFYISLLMLLGCVVAGGMSIIIKGFITWYSEIKLKEELNHKNHQIELALIKSQLDPHFLFNTINNIDVLMVKDAELASEYLNKLSDMLRFMLYETKSEKIALSKEIAYIEKYIALQKIRTSNENFVSFVVNGDLKNKTIPPMLFIPFIENAFKYVSNKKTENAISISLFIESTKIIFVCENKYNEKNNINQAGFNGLGNELIRKRIELLYPKKHELSITNQNNDYKIKLTINND